MCCAAAGLAERAAGTGAAPALALLCLNAGRGGSARDPRERTADGVESIMQVNALSHFLLAAELMPLLRAAAAAGGARVVSQSSGARKLWHRVSPAEAHARLAGDLSGDAAEAAGKFDAWQQYCLSKAANCLFTIALNERLAAAGGARIVALASDPGLCSTGVNVQHNLGFSLMNAPDGVLPTTTMHDLAGHHAADGALNMALACVDKDAAPNSFYSPAGTNTGAPRRNSPASLASAENAHLDPMNEGRSKWADVRATARAFFAAAEKATGAAPDAFA